MTVRFFHAVAICAILTAFMAACNKNNDQVLDASAEAVSMQNNESEDAVQDAIDAAEDAFDGIDDGLRNGRSEEAERCATIRINENTRTITVDFGNGCNVGGNRTRKGKMTITYRGVRNILAERTIVLDNYHNGTHTISGTIVISERTFSGTVLSYQVTGSNLTITRPNGKQMQISEFRRAVRYNFGSRPLDPTDDEMQITGTTTGTTEDGKPFTANIVIPVIMKGSCIRANTFYPVSGRYEIKSGNLTVFADWGNGDCDKKITIIVGNLTIERTMP
ncbi:MAG: hypothetical protein RMJ87_03200 [Cytophagales bacterium]|nr:hypothetical protein [Bernardetiaceae bacterium]MDW8204014.1 hypothetical protein [Cytophagales bacterium]